MNPSRTQEINGMEQAKFTGFSIGQDNQDNFRENGPAHELGLWLRALASFCQVSNHPAMSPNQPEALSRDWTSEVRLTRRVLLRGTQLA